MGKVVISLWFVVTIGVGLGAITQESASSPAGDADVGTGILTLPGAVWGFFTAIAEMDHEMQTWLWETLPPDLRALLGVVKLLGMVLVIWGLLALRLLGRLVHLLRAHLP